MMITYVIGDVHGGFKPLEQVLERVSISEKSKFIFLGDYVDGWSESAEVISFLIDFSKKHECVFIRGNHDELLYRYLKFGESNPAWTSQGGESSIKSYSVLSEKEKESHIHFFEQLENFHIDSHNRLFVHAGFTNLHGPQFEFYPNLVFWDRTLWELASAINPKLEKGDPNYPKRLSLFSEIFIGHTPISKVSSEVVPKNFANVWNIDTGAAFKGRVSVMEINSKEIWQSEPSSSLYPEEQGRN